MAQWIISVAVHALLIGIALSVWRTERADMQASARPPVVFAFPPPSAPAAPRVTEPRPLILPSAPVVPSVAGAALLPAVEFAVELPIAAAPAALQLRGRPSEAPGAVEHHRAVPAAGALEATLVDSPVGVLTPASVRYPPVLRHSGVEGVVDLEFVVDTSGRAEPQSVEVARPADPSSGRRVGRSSRLVIDPRGCAAS